MRGPMCTIFFTHSHLGTLLARSQVAAAHKRKNCTVLDDARGGARGVTQAVMMVLQKGGRHNIIATCPPSAMQRSRSRQGGTGVAMLPVGRASRVEDPSTETAP